MFGFRRTQGICSLFVLFRIMKFMLNIPEFYGPNEWRFMPAAWSRSLSLAFKNFEKGLTVQQRISPFATCFSGEQASMTSGTVYHIDI